jgi:hypothetical protein
MADESCEQRPETPPPNALPEQLRAGIERMSGGDLSGVQIHSNSALPASVGALADTRAQNIHLAPAEDHHLPRESRHMNDDA